MKGSLARFAYVIAFLAVVSFAFVTLRGPRGLHALFEKQALIKEMEWRNESLGREVERKREHIKRLSENPTEQELEIRDRLKLVHPNEKVYIIGDPQKK
jgi:cell division protein FtsB